MTKKQPCIFPIVFWTAFFTIVLVGLPWIDRPGGMQRHAALAAPPASPEAPDSNGSGTDAWKKLQQKFEEKPDPLETSGPKQESVDPWSRLRAIYLPFSEQEETAAKTDRTVRQSVSRKLHAAVSSYTGLIREASTRFGVPREIIAAVILVESGGNHRALADRSTAAGLMQTISATFSDARKALARRGMDIPGSPFDPEASIMAGTWYLDRMYVRARADKPEAVGPRDLIESWKYPLEYYYAGPGHGVKNDPVVLIYSGGKKIAVDKPAYSSKVLKWAEIMRRNDA